MTDVFTKKKRSEVMSKIRATDTKPELTIRKFLFSKGFRFRIHQKNLPSKPDIVLKKHNSIVLVNGCFWHGHKNCKNFRMPKSKLYYWQPKISNNIKKDITNRRKLKKMGWKVIVIWECDLKKSKIETTFRNLIKKILA